MSSHNILLVCSHPDCDESEFIYTGNIETERFPDSGPHSFESEVLSVPCNAHVPPEEA